MSDVQFSLVREIFTDDFTLGQLLMGGGFFAFTCEDADRKLEENPFNKIAGKTAIPRGYYRLTASESVRFKRIVPLIVPVPGFSGVRIHGGNTHEDTEGCPLIGAIRTPDGVKDCAGAVAKLLEVIQTTEAAGGKCWIKVK